MGHYKQGVSVVIIDWHNECAPHLDEYIVAHGWSSSSPAALGKGDTSYRYLMILKDLVLNISGLIWPLLHCRSRASLQSLIILFVCDLHLLLIS